MAKIKGHQPLSREVAWMVLLLNPFRQAPIPARTLWPLIRMAGMEMAPAIPVRTIALALDIRMTLI
jgi:hypothetical protein